MRHKQTYIWKALADDTVAAVNRLSVSYTIFRAILGYSAAAEMHMLYARCDHFKVNEKLPARN